MKIASERGYDPNLRAGLAVNCSRSPTERKAGRIISSQSSIFLALVRQQRRSSIGETLHETGEACVLRKRGTDDYERHARALLYNKPSRGNL